MPHDSRGALLKKGDRVLVEFELQEDPSSDDGYCNANCVAVIPHQPTPPPMSPPHCVFNTRMLTRIGTVMAFALLFAPACLADERGPIVGSHSTIVVSAPELGYEASPFQTCRACEAPVAVHATVADERRFQPVRRARRAARSFLAFLRHPFRPALRG